MCCSWPAVCFFKSRCKWTGQGVIAPGRSTFLDPLPVAYHMGTAGWAVGLWAAKAFAAGLQPGTESGGFVACTRFRYYPTSAADVPNNDVRGKSARAARGPFSSSLLCWSKPGRGWIIPAKRQATKRHIRCMTGRLKTWSRVWRLSLEHARRQTRYGAATPMTPQRR